MFKDIDAGHILIALNTKWLKWCTIW